MGEGQDGSAPSLPAWQRSGWRQDAWFGKTRGEEQTERRAEGSERAPSLQPPPWAGHPPLIAQAAAEEEEGHSRDLQRPLARGLEYLPAEGSPSQIRLLPGDPGHPCPWPQPQGSVDEVRLSSASPSPPSPRGTHTNQCSPRSISSCPANRARASRRAW